MINYDFVFLTVTYNRAVKTRNSVEMIVKAMEKSATKYLVLVVDNNSSDDTVTMLNELMREEVVVLLTPKDMYWAEGMNYGFEVLKENHKRYRYLVPFNDDIDLNKFWYSIVLDNIKEIEKSKKDNFILTFPFLSKETRSVTYGAVKSNKWHKLKFKQVEPKGIIQVVDTLNMNFCIIPESVIVNYGFLSAYFKHSLADFDYGLRISKYLGVYLASDYIGYCERNSTKGTSKDRTLNTFKRIKHLHSVKEQPFLIRFKYFSSHLNVLLLVPFFLGVYINFLQNDVRRIYSKCNYFKL